MTGAALSVILHRLFRGTVILAVHRMYGQKTRRRCFRRALKNYEIVLVFSLSKGEEAAQALKTKFTDLISKHGTLGEVEEWGKRKLAYPINYETEGYYVIAQFSSEESFPAELDRVINITDGVLRSLIVAKGE